MPKQEGPGAPAPSMCEPIGDFDVVSDEEWRAARETLLVEEKALMKAKDRLVAKRRRLPVTAIDRNYKFLGTNGDMDLLGLFEGCRQLIGDRIFRTYCLNGRGIEEIGPVWSLLDMTPLGRQESWQDVPCGRPQGDPYIWWRLHDNYGSAAEPRRGETGRTA